jgi:hypothetical protein
MPVLVCQARNSKIVNISLFLAFGGNQLVAEGMKIERPCQVINILQSVIWQIL